MVRKSLTVVLLVCVSVGAGASRMLPLKTVKAVRTDVPPVIDGLVNDPQWQKAPPVLDFTQYDPDEGGMPTELTSVRLLYDDRALYVGVICYDSHPQDIVRQLTRRDRSSEADRFSVMIDSYFDHQTAFVFVTNVSGVQSDGVLSQDGAVYDITWDAVWAVKTKTYRDGWSAEFEIPYNALRFAERSDGVNTWGINFRRYISRKKETDEWVMVPRRELLQISNWGVVAGLRDITPPLHLELLPYVSGTASAESATPGHPWNSSYKAQGGIDMKYGVTRNFTIDATINPDFGQVEVDQSVLNLTVFETRFPEKRPFFVEGAQLFTFGSSVDNTPLSLLFSRRIGKRPTGSTAVDIPEGGSIVDNPQVTTILGAAKISGRSNAGFSIGAVSAVTDEMSATVDSAGHSSTFRTEPRGVYNVFRFKQDFDRGSWFGGMGTVASRENVDPAFSGGLDWNVRMGGGAYTLDGYAAWARASTYRQRSDGTFSDSRDGAAGRLLFSRISSEHWFYTGSFDFYTRDFNCNDLGFFAQPHDYGGYVQLLYRENFSTGIFRRYALSVVPDIRGNWDGVLTRAVTEFTFTGELTSFWKPTLVYDLSLPAYDDEERGIIGTYKRPLGHWISAQITSDERKDVSATASGVFGFDSRGKRSWTASLGVTLRPVSWLELNPMMLWMSTRLEEAWIPGANVTDTALSPSPFSVFADRRVDELDFELRGTITFTRTLSMQFYSQVLVARAKYENDRRFVGGEAVPYDPAGVNADFSEAILNANVLLRWEYLPGSTLYLVWTQERYDYLPYYGSGFEPRFRQTFALPHQDVLLLKVSYWLPL